MLRTSEANDVHSDRPSEVTVNAERDDPPQPVAPELRRVCVAFLDCHRVAQRAANYLILSQNRLQRVFEFSAFNLDRMRTELTKDTNRDFVSEAERDYLHDQPEEEIDIDRYVDRALALVMVARRYVDREVKREDLKTTTVPPKWVIFTETRFLDNYYSSSTDDVVVVSLGRWRTAMAPPSALEFVLRMTQAACADFFLGLHGEHYFTKGCLFDYNEYIQDGRLMVLVGDVCESCRRMALEAGRQAELDALLTMIDHTWIGDTTKNDTVASVLKKVFDYDLYVSRGLSANRLETFWDNVTSSSTQEFVRLLAAVLLAYLLLKFGLKAS
jgi:hypothetical protein